MLFLFQVRECSGGIYLFSNQPLMEKKTFLSPHKKQAEVISLSYASSRRYIMASSRKLHAFSESHLNIHRKKATLPPHARFEPLCGGPFRIDFIEVEVIQYLSISFSFVGRKWNNISWYGSAGRWEYFTRIYVILGMTFCGDFYLDCKSLVWWLKVN